MNKILANNKNTFLIFLVLSFLFYGNSVKNGFSLDDSYVTITNYPVKGKEYKPNNLLISKGVASIPKIWQSHYGYGQGTAYDYRPLVLTMFALEYAVFGQAPHINHFINIVLYAALILCLFLFLKKCLYAYSYKESFSFVCALLFLAHPIHTEVVNNIKCRDELLALLLMLLSAINIFNYFEDRKIWHIVFATLYLFMAFYCKLTAAIFIVLIPMSLFFFSKINLKQTLFLFVGLLVCFLLYQISKSIFIAEKEVRFFYHFENPLYTETISFYTKILFALKTFGMYVNLLFFPYPLRFYYGTPLVTTNLNLIDFKIITALIFLGVSFYYYFRTKNKIALFGLLFFLISIAPLTNFISPVAGIIGERLCFTASIGFVVFITSILFSLYKTIPDKITGNLFSQKPLLYLSVVLIIFLFLDWKRNAAWQSEFSLYEHDGQYAAKSAGGNNLLGNKYYEMLSNENKANSRDVIINKSLACYTIAYEVDSSLFSALNNAGVIYYSYLNQTDKALTCFKRAIRNNPRKYPQAYENVGNCYKRKGDFIQAFKNYRIATFQNPNQAQSYAELIKLLIESKRFASALPLIKEADAHFPKNYFFTTQYANYFLLSGNNTKGIEKLEEAFVISPNKKLAEYIFNKCSEFNITQKAEYYKGQYALLPQ